MLLSKIVFVGGKGGVGKSTISSSLALNLSQQDKKTLLISTDPAHNLNDIFNLPYSQAVGQINSSLTLKQIDPQKEVVSYIQKISKDAKTLIGANHYEMIDRYYKSASQNALTQESALFDRLVQIITQEQNLWDHIVIDTAPTGHTLRFFTLAQTLKTWSKTMLGYQKKNTYLYDVLGSSSGYDDTPLIKRLEARYTLYNEFQTILTNANKTSIVFVLNPDMLSISETQRALIELKKDKIQIQALAINKVFPQSQDPFFQTKYEVQTKYLNQIQADFPSYKHWFIPFLSEDISNAQQLSSLLSFLFQAPNS